MDLMFTKMGGSQTASTLDTKLKVKRHVDDKLAFNLFRIWHDKHKANVQASNVVLASDTVTGAQ